MQKLKDFAPKAEFCTQIRRRLKKRLHRNLEGIYYWI